MQFSITLVVIPTRQCGANKGKRHIELCIYNSWDTFLYYPADGDRGEGGRGGVCQVEGWRWWTCIMPVVISVPLDKPVNYLIILVYNIGFISSL